MADFVKIGRDIVVGKGLGAKHWAGPVVFGRDAIFACPNVTRWLLLQGYDSTASAAGAVFGTIGVVAGLVGHAVVGALQETAHTENGWKGWVVDYKNLPRDVIGSCDWPLKNLDRPVIVVNREHVNRIERKGGKLLVETRGGTFRFALKFFGRNGAVESVSQLGWQVC